MAKVKFSQDKYTLIQNGMQLIMDETEIREWIGQDSIILAEKHEDYFVPCYTIFSPYKQAKQWN